MTFLFLNEISGSRRWLQDHPAEAKQVKYMFSLDMTGEDVAKTGGTFLIERYPDPARCGSGRGIRTASGARATCAPSR